MKKLTAFECDYCKQLLRTNEGIKRHEQRCFANPVMRTCKTCNLDNKPNHIPPRGCPYEKFENVEIEEGTFEQCPVGHQFKWHCDSWQELIRDCGR